MKLNEVYAKSGLGKWFKKESATKEPGWDRYNTAGKRVGKCGDAKEGQPYSACLSAQKARKLGKEGIGNFVKRKRAAQSKAGRGKKGTGAKGKKPINVETGAAKRKVNEEMKFVKENWANDILKSVWGMTDEQIDADKAKIQQQARAAMSPEELKAYDARDAEANKIMTDTAQRLRNLTAQSQDLRASMEANQQRLRDTTERNMGLKQESNAQREAALKDIKSGNYKPYAEYQGSSPTRPGKYLPVVRSQAEKEAALQALDTKPTTSTPPKQWKTAADVVGGLMGMLNTPTAVTEAADCGCEHSEDKKIADKLIGKLKKKQIKENAPVHHFTPETIKEYTDFTELTLSPFKGKKALIETVDGDWYGVLGVFKNNYALFEGETVKKVIEPTEVIKVICEGTKILILEKNKPNDPDKWNSCKSAAKSKFDVYPCVTMDSYAVTKTGPATYENLKIGQEILTYNIKEDTLEWKPVLNLHHFENAPVVEMGKSTGFKIKCTPNHKWVVQRGENYQNTDLIETKDINKHMKIVTCSVLNNDSTLIMENWCKKDSWTEKVLSMSKEQREIFLASAIVYDGHDKGISTRINDRHSFGFSQKNEDHFYATVLAAFLNGYHVSFADKEPDMMSASIIRNKKTHNTQNLIVKSVDSEDVWCPETENNTWVMIQNGFITITGNSAYANAWAAKCYKKKGGTWRSVKEETDITAELLNEVIKHKDGKWVVMNKNETKVLGTHESKTKALAQLRAIEASKARHGVHEGVDLVLKDTLKDLFFSEEVVNKDHKGTMTAAEKKKRDEIAAEMHKRGNIKRIKTDERLDSQEEAEFRTATFKVLAMRKGKGKKSKK